jgi:hypothetical protein
MRNEKRNRSIANMHERGATLLEIGRKFNISREQVRQIMLKRAAQERQKAKAKRVRLTRNAPVSILQLSARPTNCLAAENIKTVRKLLAYSEAELMRLPNFGRVSLEEIKRALTRHGCRLAGKPLRPRPAKAGFVYTVKFDKVDHPTLSFEAALQRALFGASSATAAEPGTPAEAIDRLRALAEGTEPDTNNANGKGRPNGH